MSTIWLLSAAGLALLVVLVLLLARRTHDDLRDTVRSFDNFREALSPSVSSLRTSGEALRSRIDDERPEARG